MSETVLNFPDNPLSLSRPAVMGVLNVTPDSFSDGGRYTDRDKAVAQALALWEAGADIIDIGGESTRPGAQPVAAAAELERVVPVIAALRAADPAIRISVDTSKPEVMAAALEAGAGLVNDVRALTLPGALETVARYRPLVCVMHMQGQPETMQKAPRYQDVVAEVETFLQDRLQACRNAGIPRSQLLADPGFGFGKTVAHNIRLLAELPRLQSLGVPLLVGLSRKSIVGALTGRPTAERLPGSLAAALLALERGARILRVHDVAETRDVVEVWHGVQILD